jgi:hypothetical protein
MLAAALFSLSEIPDMARPLRRTAAQTVLPAYQRPSFFVQFRN